MHQPITDRTIGAYLETLASSNPTPGGGSVAGVIGALGCGLGSMVIALTNSDDEAAKTAFRSANEELLRLQHRFTLLAERDEEAYRAYRHAAALPRSSPEEKSERRVWMQEALKLAATVPLETADAAVELTTQLEPVLRHGNPHLLSDARIAVLCASTCFQAARINVNVNLAMIRDEDFVAHATTSLEELTTRIHEANRP